MSLPQTSSLSLSLSLSPDTIPIILDLLAVDHLIDSYTPMKQEQTLWNELLAVDLECGRAHFRDNTNIATAPALRLAKDLLLHLLRTNLEVDTAGGTSNGKQSSKLHQCVMSMELHESYATRRVHSTMERCVDVDDSKRIHKFIESEDNAIIGEMYMVDCNVSGAKRRSLLVEDLQCLLDVHRFMDG